MAGGVTSLVCPPDTDPVLDEPGLVEMLKFRAEKLHQARVFPLGALTRSLQGEVLTEMAELTEAGCVGFSQAEVPLANTQVLQRALQYAATFGYTSVAAAAGAAPGQGRGRQRPAGHAPGPVRRAGGGRDHRAAHHLRADEAAPARACTCAASAARPAWRWCGRPRTRACRVTCDVSINSLHLTDTDIGYFDSRMRLNPPLRQQRDRDALREALADGTIDALVSDHTPVDEDAKTLPFAEAEPGATGLELLLGLALKWGQESGVGPAARARRCSPASPPGCWARRWARCRRASGQLVEGGIADVCVFDPQARMDGDARGAAQPGQAHAVLRLRAAGARALHHRRRARSPSKAGTAADPAP